MVVTHEKISYMSRVELIRKLLLERKHNKSTIARLSQATPQLVNEVYNNLVKYSIIDDYYPQFVKERKLKRLAKRKKTN